MRLFHLMPVRWRSEASRHQSMDKENAMRTRRFIVAASVVIVAVVIIGSYAAADSANNQPAAGQPEMQPPPGWTMEDMQAVITAGTPGKMHERLTKDAGTWKCKCTMWMAPGADPITSEGKSVITPIMDGLFTRCEMSGETTGMGPYTGVGTYGFDNVSQKFVSSWIDNHGSGIMSGEGELSADGKTLTWEYVGNCPITRKPIKMREIETVT